ncbi:DedA family protein [Moraxella sp. Tifton1]|uniref:DedA family protein n=1 Tax=Moraxella oculi TaxID=2940516 RepID=UPI002011BFF9|nr:DedA family protein [Moraxella sp. Tifton1]MCL1623137.1 DedA family protein [Moraxella sp. Tifton1]
MDTILQLIDFIIHIDAHLAVFLSDYGMWIYGILFLIIFIETGFVVMPFLPGDSLLFAVGALAAVTGELNPALLIGLLFLAAVLGDTLNYHIGQYVGPKVFQKNHRLINQHHLLKTQEFFDRHGGKTIIFARFLPFARTFAPFVAGAGGMNYQRFLAYNVIGGFCWIASFISLGFFFGNQPVIKDNFTYVIFGIVAFTTLPIFIGFIKNKLS